VKQDRFYLLAAGDLAGETAEGPYSKAEANIRATADPSLKVVTEAQLEARRAQPTAQGEGVNYVCDMCGFQSPDLQVVKDHLQAAHGVDDTGEVGSFKQDEGLLTLTSGGETTVIDLEAWLRDHLGEG
jgi:hypothetical protein